MRLTYTYTHEPTLCMCCMNRNSLHMKIACAQSQRIKSNASLIANANINYMSQTSVSMVQRKKNKKRIRKSGGKYCPIYIIQLTGSSTVDSFSSHIRNIPLDKSIEVKKSKEEWTKVFRPWKQCNNITETTTTTME